MKKFCEKSYTSKKFDVDERLHTQNTMINVCCRQCAEKTTNEYLEDRKWRPQFRRSWEFYVTKIAAKHGHLDCLKLAHLEDCPWNENTCYYAAYFGHLDCLAYAHENGCEWGESTYNAASGNGHLDCLKYLHEKGCTWDGCKFDKHVCRNAAMMGHLEKLRYAHENGAPWDEWTCHYALEHGHFDCLMYAIENDCPIFADEDTKIAKKTSEHRYVQNKAATVIQRTWRKVSNDPYHLVGNRVVLRRFDELAFLE